MPALRNQLASSLSGGPRQFSELRDKLLVELESFDSANAVISELSTLNLEANEINNTPILVARPRTQPADVFSALRERVEDSVGVRKAEDEADSDDGIIDVSDATIEATSTLIDAVQDITGVASTNFVLTFADYGPENLRVSPLEMDTIPVEEVENQNATLDELHDSLGTRKAWSNTRGNNAIVAIFDTGFARNLISSSRTIATFNSGDTDSAYAPAEGHGTMCAGAAAANTNDGVPFNGAAPDADVVLCRITDSEGQIRSDIITEAWDFIGDMNVDKPIIANHSYGTPICSGRPRTRFCGSPTQSLISRVVSGSDVTAVYAAGNEAMQCGHRPSGLTNAITGANSIEDVITVGALRFDGREAQRYSSHGRGDCAPVADPKPNVSCALPMKTYYGASDGWKIKDMGIGVGGSAGGTSHASPYTAGQVALLQSLAVKRRGEPLQTEELKQIMHNNANVPHRTHINTFGLVLSERGYDARFGHGQLDIQSAMEEI